MRWYISGLLSKRLLLCVFPCPLFCLSLELQTEQAVFARLLSPSSDWLTALWVARYQAYHWSHSGAFTLVNTAESAASVIAKFSLTNATYNFVLTIVPSFCLFNRNFPPNNPSAFSIFNSVSPSWLTAGTRRFRVGENTGSKQSCVNCVKIFYRINRGHINLID